MRSLDFWRLRPEPKLVAAAPGETAPHRWLAAAATEDKDLGLVYLPDEKMIQLAPDFLPPTPHCVWFNPANGRTSPAGRMAGGSAWQFATPQHGDWLLLIRGGKR
jgi:hypothetical protein